MPTIPPLAPVNAISSGQQAAPAANAGSRGAADKSREAFRQFEAFVLQSFITEMLPKNAANVFGKGTAGAVWRSLLAEKLAAEIAKGEGLGIAERIAAGAGTQAHSMSPPPMAAIPSQEPGSVAMVDHSLKARHLGSAFDWSKQTSAVTDPEQSGDHS